MRTILRLLISLKTAVLLISFLAVLSMIGTFVPQQLDAVDYLKAFPKFGHWILALGFDDMYHGKLFIVSLWLLSISTLFCTVTRAKLTYRRYFERLARVTSKEVKAMPINKIVSGKELEELSESFEVEEKRENEYIGLRVRGKAYHLGGALIHIGFLAILAGGLIGVFYSVEMAVRGRVGEKSVIAPVEALRAGKEADRISREARNLRAANPNNPELDKLREQVEKLHKIYAQGLASPAMKLAFKKLSIDYHKDDRGEITGIKSWISKVSVIDGATETVPVEIKVNQPFTYGDFTFYQASWNKIFSNVKVEVNIIPGRENQFVSELNASFPQVIELELNKPVKPDWSPFTFVLHDFMPDFRIIDERFVSVSNELNNPAAMIIAYDEKKAVTGRAWAFPADKSMLGSHGTSLPFSFTYLSSVPEFESGLQLAYDPGKTVVWIGCLLFTLGLIMSFYIPYIEEWVVVQSDKKIILAVSGNRSIDILNEKLEKLSEELFESDAE